eukprot:4297821-Pyramimonas_sp.AAC.1
MTAAWALQTGPGETLSMLRVAPSGHQGRAGGWHPALAVQTAGGPPARGPGRDPLAEDSPRRGAQGEARGGAGGHPS